MIDLENKNLRTFQVTQDSVKDFIHIVVFFACTVFHFNTFVGVPLTLAENLIQLVSLRSCFAKHYPTPDVPTPAGSQ